MNKVRFFSRIFFGRKLSAQLSGFLALLLALFFALPTAQGADEPFPECDAIKSNVVFWEKVYSVYPSTNGLVHDSLDLSIIYEVIDLLPQDEPGARKINRKRVANAKEKYREILIRLAAGHHPQNEDEKRIRDLWGADSSSAVLLKAAEKIRFQLCQKDRFGAGIIRSGAFLEEIKDIFQQYNLPTDLAYLPHVESSFNYKAYSKFGAAGIWQFTRSTGRRFMTVDYTLDERRDPIIATHAAARFLKENYELLGSWPLAITAYNHGTNGMLRAKKKIGGYERIFSEYNGKRFKFASRNFYSEFLAARHVAKTYKDHFGDLVLDHPKSYFSVSLPGFAPVDEISRHFKVDPVTLQELNPALRSPVFEGRKYIPKEYSLRLPESNGRIHELASVMPESMFQPQQRRSQFYTVERGDTAGVIARRHGVKLEDLIMANGLGYRATIYAGQNLRIPLPEEKVVPVLAQTAAKQEKRILVAMAEVNLESVATSPEKALQEGGLSLPIIKDAEVKEKEDQAVPVAEAPEESIDWHTTSSVVVGNLKVENVQDTEGQIVGEIKVEAGETLGHYADWLGVPTREIRFLNDFRYGRPIHLAQKVRLEFALVTSQQFEEKRYEFHKETEEDFFAAYAVEGTRSYRVKQGDTIWFLCHEEFDLPFWIIKKYNTEYKFNTLRPGQELIIPVVRERLQEAELYKKTSEGRG
ncbi:MAG: transglycosylase SLT domain-containing protein [Desulfobulbaceae bacterium]|uniref:Transglycosylase SLT domain-containing protein n=1 Tax=Candidatus Desulfobia pelagia TaxID=2841692 RepID=A0A8J6TBG1_9BACT|nr:transglycosylase SLT domain-containing protein [Candidatus Desulfobia pelagia]